MGALRGPIRKEESECRTLTNLESLIMQTIEITSFFGSILGVSSALAPNYQTFALLRFLVGFMLAGVVQW